LVLGLWLSQPVMAMALTKLTLTPASGTYKVNDQIKVDVGIDSGTDKVYTGDLYMVFDASKLELLDAVSMSPQAFPFELGQKNIDNTAGKFDILLAPLSTTTNLAEVAKGGLISLTFRAKAIGTGFLNFNCTAGSTSDTNIFNPDLMDVVDCASNQSGSYTIQAGDSTAPTPTTGSTVNTTVTTPTTVPSQLPQTGVLTPTLTLLILGIVGIIGSAFLIL